MRGVPGQNMVFGVVIICCISLICASFLLTLNSGEDISSDERVIEYSYQNEGDNPQRRNRFRRIQIHIENIVEWSKLQTKSVRLTIHRNGEINDTEITSGPVLSVVIENLAKMNAVIFNYEKCIEVTDRETKLILFILLRSHGGISVKTITIVVDRVNDQIAIIGRELSPDDIWTNSLSDNMIDRSHITLDKGFLQILGKRINDKNNR